MLVVGWKYQPTGDAHGLMAPTPALVYCFVGLIYNLRNINS